MTAYRGAIWKTGTKDDKVYVQLWNYEDTQRLIDSEMSPEQAYQVGQALIDAALKQGHNPT